MSLSEAMLDIAEDVESFVKTNEEPLKKTTELRPYLLGLARQIRMAVKACEGLEKPKANIMAMDLQSQVFDHRAGIEAAKAEFRSKKVQQEESEPVFCVCVGGKSDGVSVPVDPNAPFGQAKMMIGGS